MIRSFFASLGILVLMIFAASQASANNATDAKELEEARAAEEERLKTATAEKPKVVTYVPPRRGSMRTKTPGGVRGRPTQNSIPRALAPSHVAFTQNASPTLYFHIDRAAPTGSPIVLTVMAEDKIDPDLEIPVEPTAYPGFGRVRLADHGLELRKGVEYEWSVTVQLDAENPSLDPIDQGWIERVDPPADLDAATADTSDFAEQGLWYEALDHAFGGASTPNAVVNSLLEQIRLPLP